MISNPLVSVIITTCSRSELFKRALLSVIEQTYKNLEIIVVDDSDEYCDVITCNQNTIRQFADHRIQYFTTGGLKGLSFGRNIGISFSNGEYIAFLDDDDYWLSEKIATQLFEIGEYDGILTASVILVEKGQKFSFPNKKGFLSKFDLFLGGRAGGQMSSILVKSNICHEIKFEENHLSEDQIFFAMILFSGYKLRFIEIPLVFLDNIHNSRLTITNKRKSCNEIVNNFSINHIISKPLLRYNKFLLSKHLIGLNRSIFEIEIKRVLYAFKNNFFFTVLAIAVKFINFVSYQFFKRLR